MSGRKCTNCGGSDIEVDSARGDAVCTTCGSVLENSIIVAEVQFEEGARGSSNAIGQFVSADSKGVATKFGASFHIGNAVESREVTLRKARIGISQLCNQLRMNEHCIDIAHRFYKRSLSMNLTRGRRKTHVYAACVYLTCRTERTAHLLIDVSDALQICCYELGRTYLRLSEALSIPVPSVDPCIYILRFASQLQFGNKTQQVVNAATMLVQRMKKDFIHSGRRPSGVCGAALLIAARFHDFGRTLDDIVKIVRVHQTTLRRRLMEFGNTPTSSLTPEEFMTVDLEEEQDPPSFKESRMKERELVDKFLEDGKEVFTDLQKQIELELDKNKANRKLPPKSDSEAAETTDPKNLITVPLVAVDDEAVELGPNIKSWGLPSSLEDASHYIEPTQEPEYDYSLKDVDDAEIDTYILSDAEHKIKMEDWNHRYKDYLEEQRLKAEKLEKERAEGKPDKKRKRNAKKKMDPARSAGEAIKRIIQEKKLSSKINYDVLRELDAAPVQNEETVTVEHEITASTSESIKRRKLNSMSESRKKPKLIDVGLPFFQDDPKDVKEEIAKKEMWKNEGKIETKESELLGDEERVAEISDEDLDEYYDEEDQEAEEPTSELNIHELLRQHRGGGEGEEDGEAFLYDYDYDEAGY